MKDDRKVQGVKSVIQFLRLMKRENYGVNNEKLMKSEKKGKGLKTTQLFMQHVKGKSFIANKRKLKIVNNGNLIEKIRNSCNENNEN